MKKILFVFLMVFNISTQSFSHEQSSFDYVCDADFEQNLAENSKTRKWINLASAVTVVGVYFISPKVGNSAAWLILIPVAFALDNFEKRTKIVENKVMCTHWRD